MSQPQQKRSLPPHIQTDFLITTMPNTHSHANTPLADFERHAKALIADFAERQLRKHARLVPNRATDQWLQALQKAYGNPNTDMLSGVFVMVIEQAIKSSPVAPTEPAPEGWAWVPKTATLAWARAIRESEGDVEWPHEHELMDIVQSLFQWAPTYKPEAVETLSGLPRSMLRPNQLEGA